MRRIRRGVIAVATAALVAQGPATAQDGAPEITAQGFDIREPARGVVGEFGRLRLRFEAPERIAALRISERSFEVDLASTLEVGNLELFGVSPRVRNHKDVTLNFQNYLNQKLGSASEQTCRSGACRRRSRTSSSRA